MLAAEVHQAGSPEAERFTAPTGDFLDTDERIAQIEQDQLLHDTLEQLEPDQIEMLERMDAEARNGDELAIAGLALLQQFRDKEFEALHEMRQRELAEEIAKAETQRRIESENEARTDAMTEIANKRGITEWLEDHESVHDREIWIGYIDMNLLKTINDKIGHEEGDAALKHLASEMNQLAESLINENTRDIDAKPGRIGGDEFFFGVAGATRQRIEEISQKISEGMNKLGVILEHDNNGEVTGGRLVDMDEAEQDENAIPIKASIGFAKRESNEELLDTLGRADQLMYHAKERSKLPGAEKGAEINIEDS